MITEKKMAKKPRDLMVLRKRRGVALLVGAVVTAHSELLYPFAT